MLARHLFTVALAATVLAGAARGQDFACLEDGMLGTPSPWPDYAGRGAVLAPHCFATNHQDITGIERVVFLGDSITVGTPPTTSGDFYRNSLVDLLIPQFGLDSPSSSWRNVNPLTGETFVQESGDFASCADWGARASDLFLGETQLADCFPTPAVRSRRTLVVMTIGGNDVVNLAEDANGGAPLAQLIATRDAFLAEIEAAVAWFKTPGRFENGVFVVLGNIYDPTDGTHEPPGSCDVLDLPSLALVSDLVIEAQEMLLDIAVTHGVDLVFAHERFCGRGLSNDDPTAPCYRGPGAESYIDLTCVHPSPDGHDALAIDFFLSIAAAPPIPILGRLSVGVLGAALVLAALWLRRSADKRPW